MKSRAVLAAADTYARLKRAHPDAHCELDHDSPFSLLVATVLSAQSTDASVNQLTPALFRRWPTVEALARADLSEVEQVLSRIGMFRQKAKNVTRLAAQLVERHDGQVPRDLDALVALPGVGRKTANVVLGVAFGKAEGVVVDTHVARVSQRLGWTRKDAPDPIEADLMKLFPRGDWSLLSHVLIFHGRRICSARSPQCLGCPVADACPSAGRAEKVGRKAPRSRKPLDSPRQRSTTKVAARKAAETKTSARKAAKKKSSTRKAAETSPPARKTATGKTSVRRRAVRS